MSSEKPGEEEQAKKVAREQDRHRLEEALTVLKALGLPLAQLNERSALTLLALLRLR